MTLGTYVLLRPCSMPGQGMTKGGDFGLSLEDLVKAGDVPESRIDDMARRCVSLRFLALT